MTPAPAWRSKLRLRTWLPRVLLVALGVFACQQADDDDDFNGPSAGTGGTAAGSAGSAGIAASAATGGEEDVLGAAAQAGVGGTPGGAEPGAAGQAGADANVPVGGAPGDGACAACLEGQCATEWQACQLDEDCSACTACLDAQMDLGECVVMELCDIAPQATSEMLLCGLDPCVSECGFD
jgi:hypothetical protein